MFERRLSRWRLEQRIPSPASSIGPGSWRWFGYAVDVQAGVLAVGAPTGSEHSDFPRLARLSELRCPGFGGGGIGEVQLYHWAATDWQRAELMRATNANVVGLVFAASVRPHGSFLGVTAPRDQMTGQGVGATGGLSLRETGAVHLY